LKDIFGPPKSGDKTEDDVDDEAEEEVSGSVAKEEPKPAGGILEASPENPITLMDQMGGGDIETFEAPRRIEILDERWPDGFQGYELVFVKDIDGGRFGAIYADKLKAHYKPVVVTVPTVIEEEQVVEEVIMIVPPTTKSGWTTAEVPSGKHPWPWEEPVTMMVAATKDGPLATQKTFDPAGKWKQLTHTDELTEEYGRAILFHNGGMFFVALEDLYGPKGEKVEEVVDDEPEQGDEDVVEEPEAPGKTIDMEEVNSAFQRALKLFAEQGDIGIDSLLAGTSWLGDALDMALIKGADGREERATRLAETLDDSSANAQFFLATYGK
jgi:hypothetical protein